MKPSLFVRADGTAALGHEPRTPVAWSGPRKEYIVQPGETFWTIAAERYGNVELWFVLADLNPHIEYPFDLAEGDVLMLPGAAIIQQVS